MEIGLITALLASLSGLIISIAQASKAFQEARKTRAEVQKMLDTAEKASHAAEQARDELRPNHGSSAFDKIFAQFKLLTADIESVAAGQEEMKRRLDQHGREIGRANDRLIIVDKTLAEQRRTDTEISDNAAKEHGQLWDAVRRLQHRRQREKRSNKA